VTIVFRCDPEAGLGHPDVPHGHTDIEFETCEYEFVWTTVYACPLCSENDYTAIVGQCDVGSSTQPVSYAWKVTCCGAVSRSVVDEFVRELLKSTAPNRYVFAQCLRVSNV
jgi:hypothetical protein